MFRYFIVCWNNEDREKISIAGDVARRLHASSKQWEEAIATPGLLVLYSGHSSSDADCHRIGDSSGVILGKLFEKKEPHSYSPVSGKLNGFTSNLVVKSGGRQIIGHYWGRYIALVRDELKRRVYIIRDPTGGLPCMFTTYRGIRLVYSCVGDCSRLELQRFSINWDTIRAAVVGASQPQTGNTAICEISDLRAGECLEIESDSLARRFYWTPLQAAQEDAIENLREASLQLRTTVRACTHAWADCFPRIIHSLSGGLDSAITLSALSDAPSRPQVTALNYHTKTREGDERPFARMSANKANVRLVEKQVDGSKVDLRHLLALDLSALPSFACTSELLYGEFEKGLASELHASAFFQGAGGDGVFLQNGAEYSPGDYIRAKGIRWQLLQVTHDAARITSQSVWELIRRGLASNLSRRDFNPLRELSSATTFARSDVLESVIRSAKTLLHPVFSQGKEMPSGKLWHIFMAHFPVDYYRPFEEFDRPEIVFPLTSQPILELCLRIPTYTMFSGGIDRAVARQAFERDVPIEIIRRVSKGQSNHVLREMLDANLSFVRDYLLDGLLIRQEIVDRSRVEPYFTKSRPKGIAGLIGCNLIVSTLLGIEGFLRSWDATERRAAA
jgi:asparagine synthase (glutamine-hydrolysing)